MAGREALDLVVEVRILPRQFLFYFQEKCATLNEIFYPLIFFMEQALLNALKTNLPFEEVMRLLGLGKEEIIGWWSAEEFDEEERYPGVILLTKKEFIFLRVGRGVSEKELRSPRFRLPVANLTSFRSLPLLGFLISGNTQPDKGWWQRLLGSRSIKLRIQNASSLKEKLKELNPSLK